MPELIEVIREVSPMIWGSALERAILVGNLQFYGFIIFGLAVLITAGLCFYKWGGVATVEVLIILAISLIIFSFIIDG